MPEEGSQEAMTRVLWKGLSLAASAAYLGVLGTVFMASVVVQWRRAR